MVSGLCEEIEPTPRTSSAACGITSTAITWATSTGVNSVNISPAFLTRLDVQLVAA